jgi:hypothetical protein
MQDVIANGYQGKRWVDRGILLGLIVGMGVFVDNATSSISLLESINSAVLWGLAVMYASFLIVLAKRHLDHAEIENKLIEIGITFLREHRCNDAQRSLLLQRAQIGSSAGQTRAILPIFLAPFIVTLIFQSALHTTIKLGIVSVFAYVAIAFFRELGRANIDVVIGQSVVEYDYELKYPQSTLQPEAKTLPPVASTSSLKPQTLAKATVPVKSTPQGSSKQKRNRSNHR